MAKWSDKQSKASYNIPFWGEGFFDTDENGQLIVQPQPSAKSIAISTIVDEAVSKGLHLPLLIRFLDVLSTRVQHLRDAFQKAMAKRQYQGQYTPVYPIKANQQKDVVETLLTKAHVGLEAGSKPELMAVIAKAQDEPILIICNGYKDESFIELALMAQKMGHEVYLIIEKLSEIPIIIEVSNKINVTPKLGIRVRLSSIGYGKWQNTGGEKSKFGLSAPVLLEAVSMLKQHNMLQSLSLLHFHMGSQIANIRDIQQGIKEGARYYTELSRLGVPLSSIDVGGGLGVDYEGTRSRSDCSINYSLDEYAQTIIHILSDVCNANDIPHPRVITESGRAMVSHHAVLVCDISDVESIKIKEHQSEKPSNKLHEITQEFHRLADSIDSGSAMEVYHECQYLMSEAKGQYIHGVMSLEDRAFIEEQYQSLCLKLLDKLNPLVKSERDIKDTIQEKFADKYYLNFSLFQSMPDVWAIDQVFPIVPLTHLNQDVSKRAVLVDITCDSDGRLDKYIDGKEIDGTITLPIFNKNDPYRVGIFLVGAYQENLGDIHNLFGQSSAIIVSVKENGDYQMQISSHGENIKEVLTLVDYNAKDCIKSYETQLEKSNLSQENQLDYMRKFEALMVDTTYLKVNP